MIDIDLKYFSQLKSLLTVFVMSLASVAAFAQNTAEQALVKEDVQSISSQFANNVELCVPGKQGSYPKSEATGLLGAFFDAYAVKSYKQMHAGSSKDKGSNYSIGELSTDKGAFRVYIYYDESTGKQLIKELCIEK